LSNWVDSAFGPGFCIEQLDSESRSRQHIRRKIIFPSRSLFSVMVSEPSRREDRTLF
jgi:hypothetical protein